MFGGVNLLVQLPLRWPARPGTHGSCRVQEITVWCFKPRPLASGSGGCGWAPAPVGVRPFLPTQVLWAAFLRLVCPFLSSPFVVCTPLGPDTVLIDASHACRRRGHCRLRASADDTASRGRGRVDSGTASRNRVFLHYSTAKVSSRLARVSKAMPIQYAATNITPLYVEYLYLDYNEFK